MKLNERNYWTVVFSPNTENLLTKLEGTGLYLYTWKTVHMFCIIVQSSYSQNKQTKKLNNEMIK